MHPEDLLEELKANANVRKQRNLEIVYAVCKEQYERGSKDFSVATIARVAKERGGPAASTIHNKTGDDFKGLIRAWAEHTGGLTRKVRRSSESVISSVLEKIENPAVRAVMGAVLAENQKLKREVDLLKANTNVTIDMRSVESYSTAEPVQVLPASYGLTNSEREALSYAISDQFLRAEGWTKDDYGRILNGKGRQILKPGFVQALQKILAGGPGIPTP